MQYKTVAGPVNVIIKRNEDYAQAIQSYASIIDYNSKGGWELVFIQQVPVTKDKGGCAGCLESIGFGSRYESMTFNMLVFAKKDNTGAGSFSASGFSGGSGMGGYTGV